MNKPVDLMDALYRSIETLHGPGAADSLRARDIGPDTSDAVDPEGVMEAREAYDAPTFEWDGN